MVLGLATEAHPVHPGPDAGRHPRQRGAWTRTPTAAAAFRFVPGPVFCQLLMADEINRASPRTQSALLQAMQERKRLGRRGGTHDAAQTPFHVLATQNPIEQEGTYPLPEAQLDRFLLQVDVSLPRRSRQRARRCCSPPPAVARATAPRPVLTPRRARGGAGADPPHAGRRAASWRRSSAWCRGARPGHRGSDEPRASGTSPGARGRARRRR